MNIDVARFTNDAAAAYVKNLRTRLAAVKYLLDSNPDPSVILGCKVFTIVRPYMKRQLRLDLDDHVRGDGTFDEPMLAAAVADGLAEPLIAAVAMEQEPEQRDRTICASRGQLWIFHKPLLRPLPNQGVQAHLLKSGETAVLCEVHWEHERLKNTLTAWTLTAIARSNIASPERLDIDALRAS